jgi:hypothetical protein
MGAHEKGWLARMLGDTFDRQVGCNGINKGMNDRGEPPPGSGSYNPFRENISCITHDGRRRTYMYQRQINEYVS